MDISCRGRYATRAMLDLAAADPHTPLPLSRIAERQEISRKYLQQLMSELRRAGLVRVVKGVKGGFLLARGPDEVTVGDILRALEGDLSVVECVRYQDLCPRKSVCLTHDIWARASQVLERYFDAISLGKILAGEVPMDLGAETSTPPPPLRS
ncbi:MAG: Rrf2 family transcriptional regulator [Myxococcota bacterium]|jgi:Rrf2 family protein|nr:Rrf2 family transcriptional regulator [Myxococcota bacterium]